jgi:hypothetical protein
MAPAISLLSQLRFPGVGAIRLDISARHAVHLIDPRKALPPGPKLAVRMSAMGPGCVKTLRGITAPRILRLVITLKAKKRKNSSFARHYDQVRFRFHTAWVKGRPRDYAGTTTGVPRIAADLLHLPSRLSWAQEQTRRRNASCHLAK